MNVEQLVPEALKLPVRERAFLAAFLWESLDDPYALSVDLDDNEALALSEKRNAEIESVTVVPIPHAELMSHLRK
jgi:putative addiction module component